MNTQGRLLRLTSFGESHGSCIGGVLDGVPAGLVLDPDAIQEELWRRRPGQSTLVTSRCEEDRLELLSGVMGGRTLGTPIAFVIRNQDRRSKDYSDLRDVYRPSHADYAYECKYGIRDHRGGGRASARETAVRVVGGAIAKQLLEREGVYIRAFTEIIGTQKMSHAYECPLPSREAVEASPVRCPEVKTSDLMIQAIETAKREGDSLGGVVACRVEGVSSGWGEPLYDKLSGRLAGAMLSINAARGFELGDGFGMAQKMGSEVNDEMIADQEGRIRQRTNHSAGILGGISTGEELRFRVAFKPTASIAQEQMSVNRSGEQVSLQVTGRHDPCVVPRAVPIVEAQTALVLADFWLLSRSSAHFVD